MATKKKTPKPKLLKLKPGNFADIIPEALAPIRLVPLYVDIRLNRTDASDVANLLDMEADRLYDAAEKQKDALSTTGWLDLQARAESFSMIAQLLYRKIDPHFEVE
jgi:hypothetical protein